MSKKPPTDEMLKEPSMYCYEPDVVLREEVVFKFDELYLKSNPNIKFTSIKAALKAATLPC